MSATTTSPASARPGSSRWAGLRRKKVTVAVACGAAPSTWPVSPCDAARQIDGEAGHAGARSPLRRRPAPRPRAAAPGRRRTARRPRASAPSRMAGASGATAPVQRAAAAAASPRGARALAEQGQRAPASRLPAAGGRRRSRRRHCCRGRTSTATGPRGQRRRTSRATASPAASIRVRPGTPPAIASASARAISATVRMAASYRLAMRQSVATRQLLFGGWALILAQRSLASCLLASGPA